MAKTATAVFPTQPWWQHGTRPVNAGYKRVDGHPTRCSFVGMHYSTYIELHILAASLSKGMGRHVTLAQACYHAVAQANRLQE